MQTKIDIFFKVILTVTKAKRIDPLIPAPVEILDGSNIPATGDRVKIICHPLDAFCHNSDVLWVISNLHSALIGRLRLMHQ